MISRRNLLISSAGVAAAFVFSPAQARNVVNYEPSLLAQYEQNGSPYLLDFSATWCTTCQAQERVMDALQAENADYDAIPILRVDWDTYRRGQLVADMGIPRRSVLVMMQGTTELGRIVAGTGRDQIAELFDLGVDA